MCVCVLVVCLCVEGVAWGAPPPSNVFFETPHQTQPMGHSALKDEAPVQEMIARKKYPLPPSAETGINTFVLLIK